MEAVVISVVFLAVGAVVGGVLMWFALDGPRRPL